MSKNVEVLALASGNVWKVVAAAGQPVAEGDVLLIVESMKMEIPVEAECAGVLAELRCAEGEAVSEGDVVAVIRAGA